MVDSIKIKLLFPEFSDTPDDQVNVWLGEAQSKVCPAIYGNQTDSAVQFLTAHFLKIASDEGGRVGQQTGEKVGNLSRQFAAYPQFSATKDGYGTTSYGQQFLAIRSRLAASKRRPLVAC